MFGISRVSKPEIVSTVGRRKGVRGTRASRRTCLSSDGGNTVVLVSEGR